MFSITRQTIRLLLRNTKPSYQATSVTDENLGFGFLFYALTRIMRPRSIIVIGSKAGFSVIAFALGLKDNAGTGISRVECYDTKLKKKRAKGTVFFVDPSYSELRTDASHWHGIGFWDDPKIIRKHWLKFAVADHVRHYKMRSDEFVVHPDCPSGADLLYIDGDHSLEGIRHDFESYFKVLRRDALILAHDVDPALKEVEPNSGGYEAISSLDLEKFEVCRLPVFPGMAIVRRK